MGERVQSRVGVAEVSECAEVIFAHEEEYARSLRSLRLLGRAALRGDHEDLEHAYTAEAWRDFTTAVGENLATDATYGERLEFNPMQEYSYMNGHVVDSTGKPIVELVRRGYLTSRVAAEHDPKMNIQAERDRGDVSVAEKVDVLQVGEMLAVVSVDPKAALQKDPAYWKEKGYRKGLAVLQVYYRSTEDQILAGAYSVKNSQLPALREQFAQHDVVIPEDESENKYIHYGIQKFVDKNEAESFGDSFVKSYKERIGLAHDTISVTELIANQQPLVKSYFTNYITKLAAAHIRGASDPVIQSLAQGMLQSALRFNSEDARAIMRLAKGAAPNRQDVIVFEEKIRYALVEQLRTTIPFYVQQKPDHTQFSYTNYSGMSQAVVVQELQNHALIEHISSGMKAGRSYGGCASAGGEMAGENQSIFGGNGEAGELPDDKYGSRYFKCPKNGCLNERPKNQLIPKCKKCGADVSCVEKPVARLATEEKAIGTQILFFKNNKQAPANVDTTQEAA
jgi:hypothetical protein